MIHLQILFYSFIDMKEQCIFWLNFFRFLLPFSREPKGKRNLHFSQGMVSPPQSEIPYEKIAIYYAQVTLFTYKVL